ncbi:hypothetical protein PPL_05260 [Heterostelium album PN500]|uniref:Ankyrin repeat-containing protein n=1 Tax=Heterostelium pallidum (strain ATCC 26659 / Pp 5 / PN500) TaxID=670386 RepID=D3BB74_HETP5|nr:hypothetical protein PPL_05260 [Heterostelium album PN500]EFA81281.1 hypothetical protein PPL_05260 [Heterostelium album PN500]|eukprot:XP_020433399.1 hypothetical protein PPL_05260 [Heterostelium album PN500]
MHIQLYRGLFKSKVLRELIFEQIHRLSGEYRDRGLEIYKWSDLAFCPQQLVLYNYVDQLKSTIKYFIENRYTLQCTILNEKKKNKTKFFKIEQSSPSSNSNNNNNNNNNNKKNNKNNKNNNRNGNPKFVIYYILYALKTSATHGNLDLIIYLLSQFYELPTTKQQKSEETKSITPKSIIKLEQKYLKSIFNKAAGKGYLNILKYLIETYGNHDVKITTKSMNCAASNGHLQVLKWMYQTRDSTATVCNHLGLDAAANNGKLETVQFLLEMKVIPNLAAEYAADKGHLDILISLDQFNHLPTTSVALDNAATRGHMEIVRFLHSRQAKCTTNAINYAAYNGHYQVVHFLLENRSEGCTQEAMDLSSMDGHLDIVKLLHERSDKGCSQSAVDLAAGNCHFHVVQFLIENRTEGCSVNALSNAIINGHLPMFQYLAEKTAFLKDEEAVERLYEIAKSHDKLEIVEFLKNNFTQLQSRN